MSDEKAPFRSRLMPPKSGTFADADARRTFYIHTVAGSQSGGVVAPAGDVAFSSGFSTGFH